MFPPPFAPGQAWRDHEHNAQLLALLWNIAKQYFEFATGIHFIPGNPWEASRARQTSGTLIR